MLTVHYFTAPWCGPCKVFGPRLEKFAEVNNINLVKHNVDDNPPEVQEFGIMSVPTTIWLDKDGKLIVFKVGALTENQMEEFVSRS